MQTEENTYELSPEEIADVIFSKPPGDLNSIDLSLENETVQYAENEGYENFILNILKIITLRGVEILFNHTNLLALTEEQIFLIKRYTRSFGYNLIIKIENNIIYISFVRTFI